jgi:hypothetical protein
MGQQIMSIDTLLVKDLHHRVKPLPQMSVQSALALVDAVLPELIRILRPPSPPPPRIYKFFC